jgi:transglutaminase-like putative cysteine protease
MLLSIRHETSLRYSACISETVMELRMAPKTDAHQTLRGFGIAVGPGAPLFEHVDWLGNRVHSFSIVDFHERVRIVAESVVDVHREHPALETLADRLPLELADHRLLDFLRFQGPVSRDDRLEELARSFGLHRVERVGDLLAQVTGALRESFRYEKGVTSSATSVSEMLDHRAGVCQDFAHLAIALLRHVNVPARYVSGYVRRAGTERELETHAWCEAFVPTAGWVAIDPTHAQLVDNHYVAVGIGRSYADVPPNRGVFRGDAAESIEVSVRIEPVAEVPAGLLAPRPAPLEVPALSDGAVDHREEIDYQQEQRQQQQQQQQ